MNEKYMQIVLEVPIPGPIGKEQDLLKVERTFLERFVPGLVSLIENGMLDRFVDYCNNYFLVSKGSESVSKLIDSLSD